MQTLDKWLNQTQAPASFGAALQHVCTSSLFAQRLLSKDATILDDLLQNHTQSYCLSDMQQFLNVANIDNENSLKKALRQLRQRVMIRILFRDLNSQSELAGCKQTPDMALIEVMQTVTHLAEICIKTTVSYQAMWLCAKQFSTDQLTTHALGIDQTSTDLVTDQLALTIIKNFIVIGMGKLGGGELNVSSDVDLIFAYQHNIIWPMAADGQAISQQDFYHILGKKVIASLDDITEDGFVFRVDMRLRPFGSEGILVPNLDALAEYYQNNGREWERYAWIKGRVIMGDGAPLQALLKPFIFRKYLDYNALASMRDLKTQINRDVNAKGMQDNIKLGRGGIREIEFIAQVFQLIRGGRDTSLQIKPTLAVLKLLQKKNLLDEKSVKTLSNAYIFLRNLEHRLMYVDDQQTHDLPKTAFAKQTIAHAMGFADWLSLNAQINSHRSHVQAIFDVTFKSAEIAQNQNMLSLWQDTLAENLSQQVLIDAGYQDVNHIKQLLLGLLNSQKYHQLPDSSRLRFDALMPLVITEAGQQVNADATLLRVMHLLESICRRASYLALLSEFPQALKLVVKLCAASPWIAQYLAAHPILLDELLNTQQLYAVPDFTAMQYSLQQTMAEHVNDAEAQMDAMRHFKQTAIIRFVAQDCLANAGSLPLTVETLSDYLSALADSILQVAIDTIWQAFKHKHALSHVQKPHFAVIGYGKLGSKELGYVSDLDIIFLYSDVEDNLTQMPETAQMNSHADLYARFAQRINSWFNTLTNAGLLYEVDLQLRPDGQSGLLVSSVAAFRDYQMHKAWVWEHQALTRARFVAGDAQIAVDFNAIRADVLCQKRDAQLLKQDVQTMRSKMRANQRFVAGQFDLKNSPGGIIDVEFIVQYLVLLHAHDYPQLIENKGNIELLKRFGHFKLIHSDLAHQVINAYREFRRIQHALKLQDASSLRVDNDLVLNHSAAVIALWREVFEK